MAAGQFTFGPYRLDTQSRQLLKEGEPIAISIRQFDLLLLLASRPGQLLTKEQLIEGAWPDVAVTDNSLEQAVSTLRRILGSGFIETHKRRGYRFVAPSDSRESDETLDALLAPHRAWIEGRAALETLERDQIRYARDVFEHIVTTTPGQASAHVGLANACVMAFEMTRADAAPDLASLQKAAQHAREACRLDPQDGEAWATLGFVLERTGRHDDALAAARRSVTLEPDNWRHHLRLSYSAWGEERLRAARRVLKLLPGFPLAHWLAATVHVARQALPEAERELRGGIATEDSQGVTDRFSGVALHWLLGLVLLARDEVEDAHREFDRELANEHSGHLYARECCANTWYAIGAMQLAHGRRADARDAFARAIERVSSHPLAHVGTALAAGVPPSPSLSPPRRSSSFDAAVTAAAQLVATDRVAQAVTVIDEALTRAPAGSAGWLIPVEPLLRVRSASDAWAGVLSLLRARAV